jgi:hypothetical protein
MKRTVAVKPWTAAPLEAFVSEAGVRLALLMTPAGQVFAQHGFTRAVDVMSAAALGAAIVSSTSEIARMATGSTFRELGHQGKNHGIFLAGFDTPAERLVVLVIYGRESSLGLVRLFHEDFVNSLIAASPEAPAKQPVLAVNFERDLNDSLASLFRA